MTLSGFIAVLTAFLKFPEALGDLVRLLSSTPQQEHQKVLERVKAVFDESRTGGRPS